MCTRLKRCLNALSLRNKNRRLQALVAKKKHINYFGEDAFDYCLLTVPVHGEDKGWGFNATDENLDDSRANELRSTEADLARLLVRSEDFMRASVRALDVIKEIEPNIFATGAINKVALDWVARANELGSDNERAFRDNSELRKRISVQRIHMKPALARFLRLLSIVHATHFLHFSPSKQPVLRWQWPLADTNVPAGDDWDDSFVDIDIVKELKAVQALLKVQKDSQDRLHRSNFVKACAVADEAFERCSKVLVVRFDVGFRQGVDQPGLCVMGESIGPQSKIGLTTMSDYLTDFKKSFDKLYRKDCLGFIFKMEYGLEKGHHAHVIFFLNGHRRQRDIYISRELGELWVEKVTGGRGIYWNCNSRKYVYPQCGIGMIERTDHEKREILKKKVLTYLVKHDLPFEVLKVNGVRQFRASILNNNIFIEVKNSKKSQTFVENQPQIIRRRLA